MIDQQFPLDLPKVFDAAVVTLLIPSRRSLHDIRKGFLTVLSLQDVLDEQAAFCIRLVGAAGDTIKAIISNTHRRSVLAFAMGRSQNANRFPGIQRRLEEVGGAAGRIDGVCMALAIGARIVNDVSVTVSKLSAGTLQWKQSDAMSLWGGKRDKRTLTLRRRLRTCQQLQHCAFHPQHCREFLPCERHERHGKERPTGSETMRLAVDHCDQTL